MSSDVQNLATEILRIVATERDPSKMLKTHLLAMRTEVIEAATAVLQGVPFNNPSVEPLIPEVYRMVMSYSGGAPFLRDMRRNLLIYGSLSPGQIAALTAPPSEDEIEVLARHGIRRIPKTRTMAIEMINVIKREVRTWAEGEEHKRIDAKAVESEARRRMGQHA